MELINFKTMPKQNISLLPFVICDHISFIHLFIKLCNIRLYDISSCIRIDCLRNNFACNFYCWFSFFFVWLIDLGICPFLSSFVYLASQNIRNLLTFYVIDISRLSQVLPIYLIIILCLPEPRVIRNTISRDKLI